MVVNIIQYFPSTSRSIIICFKCLVDNNSNRANADGQDLPTNLDYTEEYGSGIYDGDYGADYDENPYLENGKYLSI